MFQDPKADISKQENDISEIVMVPGKQYSFVVLRSEESSMLLTHEAQQGIYLPNSDVQVYIIPVTQGIH